MSGHNPSDAGGDVARIGPNAILQLIPVLDRAVGRTARDALFAQAGVAVPPPDAGMLPETDIARLHHTLRQTMPDQAAQLAREAGLATGDYILANRIPALAQKVIRLLPKGLGSRILSGAIAKHSWTFAGSGDFTIVSLTPLTFEIAANPVVALDRAEAPICDWHAAVFERLFTTLIWRQGVTVTETACCARGDRACRFELRPLTA
ncbi:bacteriochlorophyll 4-vinyl reductase [Rhodobacter veldkampii DSM 11550]|uniref:Bacteriochlorophyll 4-vinyl reductase n=1 Tax=Phaeovulum veldkampii DSM 11550 TaxID=1185920 RepID=A0A2T4JIQ6_9RHOB|nr:bacteriochlorophyll 4-vinyl reductase [Phaeovulum veldkampii]MBK5947605.1 bacteriochlorophyll 4-vinyl reductase [Phaeovulum veldkampii DSM 11550]NCU20223.1 bacteriochlorophyll 4-vinyl reductase [Candidatus Falkowbacteria bacterium]PTE17743.1 bacteriochlorophyll 4-vinyl reductase [Phaeovulum veldkampii DSM 11550]TDQ58187.1 divinyl protochlorophyllide a 8-vinyl-reductase [Phaeovulum veldkampii DSM 11550]